MKENQKIINKASTRSKGRVCIFLALILSAMAITGLLSPAAFAEDVAESNRTLCETALASLGEEIRAYGNADTSSGKVVSQRTSIAINTYRSRILELQSSPSMSTVSLKSEIDLAHAQALAYGKATWVYQSRSYEYPTLASRTAFASLYESIANEIANSSSAETLRSKTDGYATKLNQAAFCELIRNESKATDSLSVNALAEGAIEAINKLSYTDTKGTEYRSIYEKAIADMTLRRTKDEVTAELRRVFGIIYPKSDFASDKKVALFVYQLDSRKTVEEMNIVLKNTIFSLLDPLSTAKHTSEYIKGLETSITALTDAAIQIGSIPHVSEELSDFTFEYTRASAKDTVSADIASRESNPSSHLLLIETNYNRKGGIFDLCSSIDEIEFEIKRAKLRADWYVEYKKADSEITEILAPHSPTELSEKLLVEYTKYDNSISSVLFSASNAEVLISAEFAKGCEAAAALKDLARLTKYKADHKEIIEKSLDKIGASDLEKLTSAIEDAIVLDEKLLKELSEVTKDLVLKYKAALKAELSARSFGDSASHLWKNNLQKLTGEIDSLSDALPLSDIYSSAKRVLDRAEAIGTVIKKYNEILASELFKSYSDSSKTALIEAAQGAIDIILDVNITPISWSERLAEALEQSLLTLRKAEYAANLRAMASKAKDKEASPIAEDAASKIGKAITESNVEAIYSEARFKLSRILQYEETLTESEALKKYIEGLEYLTDTEKEEFIEEISADIDSYAEKIKQSATESALKESYRSAKGFLDGIKEKADTENLKTAKRIAKNQLTNAISTQTSSLNSLVYISDTTRKALEDKLSTLKITLEGKITNATDVKALDNANAEIKASISSYEKELKTSELNACRQSIKDSYAIISAMKNRYSVENYNSISVLISASITFLDKSESIEAMISEKSSILLQIEKIPDLLDEAKAEAIGSLDALFEDMYSKKHLYSSTSFELVEKTYKKARESINSIEQFEKLSLVDTLLKNAAASLTAINADSAETSDKLILSEGSKAHYPAGYSFSQSGYSAYITAKGKIPYNVILKLNRITADKQQSVLRKLIKSDKLISDDGKEIGKDLKKQLKKCELALGFELESTVDFDGTAYVLTILLPKEINPDRIIGLVAIEGDNYAEYYNYSLSGSLLTVTIDSPENFFLAVRKSALPIVLAIIIVLALLILAAFFIYRYYRGNSATPLPVHDEGGSTALEVVTGTRSVQPITPDPASDESDSSPNEASEQENNKTETEGEELPKAETVSPEPENPTQTGDPTPVKRRFIDFQGPRTRRAEINLDLLANHFDSDEIITLDAMISKGLLPPETTFVKVLARGKISKPLTIIAQDFSTAAMRMILLAGGNATIVEEKLDD